LSDCAVSLAVMDGVLDLGKGWEGHLIQCGRRRSPLCAFRG